MNSRTKNLCCDLVCLKYMVVFSLFLFKMNVPLHRSILGLSSEINRVSIFLRLLKIEQISYIYLCSSFIQRATSIYINNALSAFKFDYLQRNDFQNAILIYFIFYIDILIQNAILLLYLFACFLTSHLNLFPYSQ